MPFFAARVLSTLEASNMVCASVWSEVSVAYKAVGRILVRIMLALCLCEMGSLAARASMVRALVMRVASVVFLAALLTLM